jgi:hypothetical protein
MLINRRTSIGLKPTGETYGLKVFDAFQTISTFYV